jgi:GTP pyrophosphokinase
MSFDGILLDRLHYMETLHTISSEDKRRRVARETLDKYTTLAARAGLLQLKDRLEDLAFHQLNPEARKQILIRLHAFHTEKLDIVAFIIEELQEILTENELPDFYILGREKTPFSIWQKMERKGLRFEQIRDIIAFRVIVNTVSDCYAAIEILHKTYTVLVGRFKDYIRQGRYPDYKALHTSLFGPFRKCIEVQVRTELMNEIAIAHYIKYWRQKTRAY